MSNFHFGHKGMRIQPIDEYAEMFINSLNMDNPTQTLFKLCQLGALISAQFHLCAVDEARNRLHARHPDLYDAAPDNRMEKIERAVILFNQKVTELLAKFPDGFPYLNHTDINDSVEAAYEDRMYGITRAMSYTGQKKELMLSIIATLSEALSGCITIFTRASLCTLESMTNDTVGRNN